MKEVIFKLLFRYSHSQCGTPLYEEPPDELNITEHDLIYKVDIKTGQKTGFSSIKDSLFVRSITPNGGLALDAFSYTGGFASIWQKRERAR